MTSLYFTLFLIEFTACNHLEIQYVSNQIKQLLVILVFHYSAVNLKEDTIYRGKSNNSINRLVHMLHTYTSVVTIVEICLEANIYVIQQNLTSF